MKSKVAYFMSACLLVLCGGLLSACGNEQKMIGTKDFVQTIETIKADTTLWQTGNFHGLETDFVLAQMTGQYEDYAQVLAIPLEYIDRNKEDVAKLDSLKLNGQANNLKADLEKKTAVLVDQYKLLTLHNEKYDAFDPGEASVGMQEKFAALCQDLTETAYDIALDIAQLEDITFGNINAKQSTQEPLTIEETNKIKDYLLLYAAKDYADALFLNDPYLPIAKPSYVISSIIKNFGTDCTQTLTGVQDKDNVYVNTPLTKLLKANEKQNAERENFHKAISDFERKNLKLNDYSEDFESGAKVENYMSLYFSTLEYLVDYIASSLF